MPRGLAPNEEEDFPIVHGQTSEGVNLILEDPAIEYISTNQKPLGINDDDLERVRLYRTCYVPMKLNHLLYMVYKNDENRDIENNDIDPDKVRFATKRLADITKIKFYKSDDFVLLDGNYIDISAHMQYVIGQNRCARLAAEMKQQNVPTGIMMQGLLSGLWCSYNAQKEFIFNHYLPKVMNQ